MQSFQPLQFSVCLCFHLENCSFPPISESSLFFKHPLKSTLLQSFSKYLLSTYCVLFLDQVLQARIYIRQMLASKNSQSNRRGRQETNELVVLKQLLLLHERRKGQSGGFKGAQPSSFLFSLSLSTSFNADTLTNKI